MRLLALLVAALPLAAQPEIAFDSSANFLKFPEHIHLGEAAGVATNSKGNVFVYTRTGTNTTVGASRQFTHGGARLFEFDRTGKYVREVGTGVYGFLFAENVRVDAKDNIWVVDRGSNMVIKFSPEGRVLMTLSRKPESEGEGGGGRGAGRGANPGTGVPGDNFVRPTDVAFDAAGNIYVADGYGNARIAKFTPSGKYIKSWGSRGSQQGQFQTPHGIAVDAKGDVYVADQGNKRIQVFDGDGTYKREITGIGSPQAICLSQGVLYSSNSNAPNTLDNGEIYKLNTDGKILGKFGQAGKLPKEFGTVNSIDCRTPGELLVGETQNWRVQKLTLR